MYISRSLSNNDLETICSFPQTAEELFYMSPKFQYPLNPDQIIKLLEGRYEPTVIVDTMTDNVVAYANLYDKSESRCWLGNVICSPAYRGKGAAEVLINTMIDKAKHKLGIKNLVLSCHNTNSRGLVFYDRLGFKPIGITVSIINERKFVTIQMQKELL